MVTTALDSNVVVAVLRGEAAGANLGATMDRLRNDGPLIVSGAVFVELAAIPGSGAAAMERYLGELQIRIDFMIDEQIWRVAAPGYEAYCERRRNSRGGQPKRFVMDFLVGAHALTRAHRLLTMDQSPYRNSFPDLVLI